MEEHKLGQTTIKAVSTICDRTAIEIENAAVSLRVAADNVGKELDELAASMRKRGEVANSRVTEFINMATSVIETARSLKDSIEGKVDEVPKQKRVQDKEAPAAS